MASANIVELKDDTFDQETASGYVLVDFWAEWCGPCRALAPVIDEIAEQMNGQLKVCKLDVDANQQSSIRFGIRGIPTVILMKDGKLVNSVTGNDPQRIKEMASQAKEAA